MIYPNCVFGYKPIDCLKCMSRSLCEHCKSKGLSNDEHYEKMMENKINGVCYYDQLYYNFTRNVMNTGILQVVDINKGGQQ